MTIAISVQEVHLSFPVVRYHARGIKEAALSLVRKSKPVGDRVFWALQGISVDIQEGEVIGLVGKNGSGKSTLLRVISGIYSPDQGRVHTVGKISSLLELGAGFREELSGYENIRLAGAILGYSPQEMDTLTPEIVEFAGIGEFMQQPLRTYSSGMKARLGFSVATAIKPDILLIDEVLAVGDADFRKKSMERVEAMVKDQHVTVIVVSHNHQELERLCTRLLLLERGKLVPSGDAATVFERYRSGG